VRLVDVERVRARNEPPGLALADARLVRPVGRAHVIFEPAADGRVFFGSARDAHKPR
jgi:hypothetical protein